MANQKSIKTRKKSRTEKLLASSLIIYALLFLAHYILSVILNKPIEMLTYIITDLTIIYLAGTSIWFIHKKGQAAINEIKKYTQGLEFSMIFYLGWLIAIIFLYTALKKIVFFLTLAEISFTITGFGFTAGAFFKDRLELRNKFFRVSTIFSVIGFSSVIFYLFFDVFGMLTGQTIPIFYYFGIFLLPSDTITSFVLVVFLTFLGILFWIAFLQLMKLLSEVPKMRFRKESN